MKTPELVNLKLGAKLGNSFYFRPELGYAVGVGGNSKVKVEYATELPKKKSPDLLAVHSL